MSVFYELSVLTVRQILAERADAVLSFLGDRFSDNSRRMEAALARSSDNAWKSLEVALSGPGWFDSFSYTRDELELQRHVRGFLDSLPPERLPGDPASYRKTCLNELRSARRVKLVPGQGHGAFEVAGAASAFARYGDPRQVAEHEHRLLTKIGDTLRDQHYPVLAHYVELRPAGGEALLVQAARFFFHREVENDPKLSVGLTVQKLDGLRQTQLDGFTRLEAALALFRPELSSAMDGVGRIEEKLERQGDELRAMMAMLSKLMQGHSAGKLAAPPTVQQVEALADQPGTPAGLARAAAEFTQAARDYQHQGGLISDIFQPFQQEAPPPPPPAPPPPAPAPRSRLLGRAFDPPPE